MSSPGGIDMHTPPRSTFRIVQQGSNVFAVLRNGDWEDNFQVRELAESHVSQLEQWDREWTEVEARTRQFIQDLARELGRTIEDISDNVCQAAA